MTKPQQIMQHMHGNIQYFFDFWADLFVHLLLLKSSMADMIIYLTLLKNSLSSNRVSWNFHFNASEK